MAQSLRGLIHHYVFTFVFFAVGWYRYFKFHVGKLSCKYDFYGYYIYKRVPCTELIHYPEKMAECEKCDQFRDDDVFILNYPKSGKLPCKYGMYGYYLYKGVPFTELIHYPEKMTECEKYDQFRDDDVYILTYPKSGTEFVSSIIHSIYKQKGMLPEAHGGNYITFDLLARNVPAPIKRKMNKITIEDPIANFHAALSPRVFGSHLNWSLTPRKVKEGKVKVIHCIRNPKDVVSSSVAFFDKAGLLKDADWNSYCRNFMSGNVIYGSWFNWMKEWYPDRHNKNTLIVYFEELVQDLQNQVEKIAKFLQTELTEEQLRAVTKANTFQKKKESGDIGAGGMMKLRKGKAGSWKADFTVEQNEMADEWIKQERVGLEDIKLIFE